MLPGRNWAAQTYVIILVYIYTWWNFYVYQHYEGIWKRCCQLEDLITMRHCVLLILNFCHWLTICVATLVVMAIPYTTWELLNLFDRITQPMKRVTTTVYNNITQLGICSVSPTHIGTTGGGGGGVIILWPTRRYQHESLLCAALPRLPTPEQP